MSYRKSGSRRSVTTTVLRKVQKPQWSHGFTHQRFGPFAFQRVWAQSDITECSVAFALHNPHRGSRTAAVEPSLSTSVTMYVQLMLHMWSLNLMARSAAICMSCYIRTHKILTQTAWIHWIHVLVQRVDWTTDFLLPHVSHMTQQVYVTTYVIRCSEGDWWSDEELKAFSRWFICFTTTNNITLFFPPTMLI